MKWIDAFLCFRQQRVVVNGVKSDWTSIVSGVPQGTVLGTLLFSLHINDIMSDIESEIRLFAESLQMTLSQRTGVVEINTQLSFRFPLTVRIPIRKASFPKQSGTGMPSLTHSFPLLNCRTIAYLNSLPLLELGTNLPWSSPGEVLSFLAFHQ